MTTPLIDALNIWKVLEPGSWEDTYEGAQYASTKLAGCWVVKDDVGFQGFFMDHGGAYRFHTIMVCDHINKHAPHFFGS